MNTNLAHTSYIKMLDCWLIFSLLKPFVDIIVQTYKHTLRDYNQETPVRNWKIDFCQTFVRVAYPVFFLVFILIFWLVGLVYYIVL